MSITQPYRFRILGSLLLMLVFACSAIAQEVPAEATPPPPPPPAPPAEAEAAAVRAEVRELFAAQYALRTEDGKASLAALFLRRAQETEDDPVGRYVLLTEARDLAAEAGRPDPMFEAIQRLRDLYNEKYAERVIETLPAMSRTIKSPDALASLLSHAVQAAEWLVRDERFEDAETLLNRLRPIRQRVPNGPVAANYDEQVKRLRVVREEAERLKEMFAAAKEDPFNPQAAVAVGRFYALLVGDWPRGLRSLMFSDDPAYIRVAELESIDEPTPDDMVALGDAWNDVATKDQGVYSEPARARAGMWYLRALPELKGLALIRLKHRMGKRTDLNWGGANLSAGVRVAYSKAEEGAKPGPWEVQSTADQNWPNGHGPEGTRFRYYVRGWLRSPVEQTVYLRVVASRGEAEVQVNGIKEYSSSGAGMFRVHLYNGFNELAIDATLHSVNNPKNPAELKLEWSPNGEKFEAVPAAMLFHEG